MCSAELIDWKRLSLVEGPAVGKPGVRAKVSLLWCSIGDVLKSVGRFRRRASWPLEEVANADEWRGRTAVVKLREFIILKKGITRKPSMQCSNDKHNHTIYKRYKCSQVKLITSVNNRSKTRPKCAFAEVLRSLPEVALILQYVLAIRVFGEANHATSSLGQSVRSPRPRNQLRGGRGRLGLGLQRRMSGSGGPLF